MREKLKRDYHLVKCPKRLGEAFLPNVDVSILARAGFNFTGTAIDYRPAPPIQKGQKRFIPEKKEVLDEDSWTWTEKLSPYRYQENKLMNYLVQDRVRTTEQEIKKRSAIEEILTRLGVR
jgi:hypothetical protein